MNEEPPSRMLLLMRHGKAETNAPSDKERALADRGEAQGRLIGEYLDSQSISPQVVLVSSARRTQETWAAVLSTLPAFTGEVIVVDELYLGGRNEMYEAITRYGGEAGTVMVVAHEPTTSAVAAELADDSSDASSLAQVRIGVPTGSVSILTGGFADWRDLTEESMTLHTLVRS